MNTAPDSQHFIFFVAYEWAQYARKLQNTRLEGLAGDKHSRLLGPFESYEENEGV
jgi:hypothetical protein